MKERIDTNDYTPNNQHLNYFNLSCWQHFKARAGWIVGLAILGLVSGYILHHYENTIEQLVILALYLPMIADTGGNSGSQAATIIIRSMALGEIHFSDITRIMYKELKISLLLSLILGITAYIKVLFLSGSTIIPPNYNLTSIAAVITIALSLQVITSTLIGAVLPLIADKLGFDPAHIATPALTTIVDITGLLIFFSIAKAALGL